MEPVASKITGALSHPAGLRSQSRYSSIDIARGVAILCMIVAHLTIIFASPSQFYYIGTLAAPFFLIIGGTSYDLLISSRARKNLDRKVVNLEIYYRAFLLIVIDMTVLFIGSFVWPSVFTFMLYWGVFQVLAFGYVFGLFFKNTPAAKAASIIGLAFLILVIDAFFSGNVTLSSLAETLLPMLIYFQFGRILFHLNDRKYQPSLLEHVPAITVLFFALVIPCSFIAPGYSALLLNRMSLPSVAIICGTMFMILLYLIRFVDAADRYPVLLKPLERVGKMAFTIFYLHFVMILLMTRAASLLLPAGALPINSLFLNVLLIILFVLVLAELERQWSKYGYKYSVEWVFREGARFLVAVTQRVVKPRFRDPVPDRPGS
jgi:peptidoglycan/LPS O-acetylase OafA/YrhL